MFYDVPIIGGGFAAPVHAEHGAPNVQRPRERGYATDAPIVTHDSMGDTEVDHDGIASDPDAVRNLELAMVISEWVNRDGQFANHPWMVKVSHFQGIAMISLPVIMGQNDCYTIPLRLLSEAVVKNACGEILERIGLPRTGFSESEWAVAVNKVPRHLRGGKGVAI